MTVLFDVLFTIYYSSDSLSYLPSWHLPWPSHPLRCAPVGRFYLFTYDVSQSHLFLISFLMRTIIVVHRSALRMSFAEEFPGATAPFGFFDPLGLSKVIPSHRGNHNEATLPTHHWFFYPHRSLCSWSQNAADEDIRRWRESEVKHGRLAMLAALGIVVGEEAELDNTPLYGDKIVGPAIYQVSR